MDVITHPNAVLKQNAAVVDVATDAALVDLVKTMARSMYDNAGVGLAAPQIGVLKRVIVYDIGGETDTLIALVNPVVVSTGEETEIDEEACLSVPGISVPIERFLSVVVEAQNIHGKPVRIEADEFHARLLQHEIDHLDGMTILDRATPEERKAALRRYREAIESGARPGDTGV